MSVEAPANEPDLKELEEHALEHLEEEGAGALEFGEEPQEEKVPAVRLAVVVAFPTLAAGIMVGGIYKGIVGPRLTAIVAGLLGIGIALLTRRIRSPILMYLSIVVGLFLAGVVVSFPGGSPADIVTLGPFVRDAVSGGDVLRPPVEFTLGWRAIVGWLMAGLGFSAAWLAIEVRRTALGLIIPLPIVAVAAISVPDSAKIPSGVISLVLFAIGLGLLSGVESGAGAEQRSLSYELRRGVRGLVLIAGISAALIAMQRANFLFPQPLFDPAQEAQRPRYVPISEVPDRVLFTVQSSISGPWRMGGLDVYDGTDWRLPPFAENRIAPVPPSGIIDSELNPGVKATFEVNGLDGAVLPGLPNLVGIVAEGPVLAFDKRTGNIRLGEGQVQPGLRYTVTAARIPTVEELTQVTQGAGSEVKAFLEMPPPPPAVQSLLERAPVSPLWARLDYVRTEFLKTVVADGEGRPVSIKPERLQDMLAGSKKGTPYEIVAGQAMLARWAGVPARIGYGFDGGDPAGDVLEIRPKHGASFLEVYFPTYKWLPIIGTPLQSTSNISSSNTQQNEDILASDDVSVRLVVPVQVDPTTYFFQQMRAVLVVVLPIILVGLLLYFGWPAVVKIFRRARRRSWAEEHGPHARIAVAYAEWRDQATDFGYQYGSDTPLMFLDRVVPDDEHTELAWLVTRSLWGDRQDEVVNADASAAEELSRSLRRRMSQAHSGTLRIIALVSRLSLRFPYAPALAAPSRKERKLEERKAA